MAQKKRTSTSGVSEDLDLLRRRRLRDSGDCDPEALASLEALSDELQAGARTRAPGGKGFSRISRILPGEIQRQLVSAVIRSGVNPAYAYAWVTSGCLVTERNVSSVPPQARLSWNRAIIEWRQMMPLERAITLQALLSPGEN